MQCREFSIMADLRDNAVVDKEQITSSHIELYSIF